MTLEDRLKDAITNKTHSVRIRKELVKFYNQLVNGVIPPVRKIYSLLQELKDPEVCGNLQSDGSCGWLRQNTDKEGLRAPLPGERVYCLRAKNKAAKQSMLGCEGYTESDDL